MLVGSERFVLVVMKADVDVRIPVLRPPLRTDDPRSAVSKINAKKFGDRELDGVPRVDPLLPWKPERRFLAVLVRRFLRRQP